MKTKKPILRLVALAALSFFTGNEVMAQTNVGSECGCPNYATRVTNGVTDITTLGTWTSLPASAYGKELAGNQNITLTCNQIWTINEKLYIGSGSTITIEPGTIIRGTTSSNVAAARALIIERGGKIMAPGTEACPIIFTAAADVMDGVTVKAAQKGLWGGVLICGKATNNLTLAANGPFVAGQSGKLAVADGLGVLEGFASSIPQDQFGASFATAPAGYALGTSPVPTGPGVAATYSITATASSAQNHLGSSTLVLTADPLSAFYGALISGTGIAPATTVTAFSGSGKSFTLSNASTANLSGSYLIGATRSATGTTPQTAGTTLILSAANSAIEIGMLVSGTGIPSNTTVSGYDNSTFTVTLSTASTVDMTGTYVFALPNTTATGDLATSTAVTLSASNTAIRPGMTVTGTGIASGTLVAAISGTSLTLSAAATATSTGATLTFGWSTFTAGDVLNCVGATKIKISAANLIQAGQTVTASAGSLNQTISAVSAVSGTTTVTTFTIPTALTASVASTTITIAGAYPLTNTTAFYPTTTLQTAPAGLADGSSTVYVNYAGQPITAGTTGFDDNDNSGVMTYVSIRHSGANLLVGSEINGLTLASVGRGTKIEHIEIVSCADDNIEIFGGTVNLKYCTTLFGNDDMYDYDLGWTGKAQFLFGMKAQQFLTGTTVSGISNDSDHGIEADSDDSQSYNLPRSTPQIYNATIIGNDKIVLNTDNTSLAAICAKENAGGTIANSIFANFRNGFNMKQSLGSASSYANGGEAWHNWTNQLASPVLASATTGNGTNILKVKCNTFVKNMTTGTPLTLSVNAGATSGTALTGLDLTQFTTTDKNIEVTSLTGFSPAFVINPTSNIVTTKNDVVPSPQTQVQLGTGCPQAPIDGFFDAANYRGAFAPSLNNENWLSDWTYSQVLNATNGVLACPTDINNDGVTNVSDFLIFSGQFGSSCN